MNECEQFVGRLKDLCLGIGLDGRSAPRLKDANQFRAKHGLEPLTETYGPESHHVSIVSNRVSGGVGTELHGLLAEIGFAKTKACGCASMAKTMDSIGIEACKGGFREHILKRLSSESLKHNWWSLVKVAAHGYLTVESLLDEAIRRAEAKANAATS